MHLPDHWYGYGGAGEADGGYGAPAVGLGG